MSCVDLPSDGLLLQICRIQMALFLCDNKDHHGSDMAITPRTIHTACRIGHTAVRLGGLAAVVKDAQSRTEVRFALSGSGGVSCFDGRPFWDLVQGLGQELDPWTAVMICDGDVVAESDVADETASTGLDIIVVRAEYLCVVNISARACGLPQYASPEMLMLQSCMARLQPAGRLQG